MNVSSWSEDIYLTKEGYEKLITELEFLKKDKRRELSKRIGEARSHGDISENAEYDAAKEAQGMNEKRIVELEHKLARARIIEYENIPKDEVLIGAKVRLKDIASGEELDYTLVSEAEADYSAGKISVNSPVGSGLLNHRINDTVEIRVPAGVLKYKVMDISR
ncbi:MAG: transcription elongation factor GreA [Candidatus Omnitrophota bacterium]